MAAWGVEVVEGVGGHWGRGRGGRGTEGEGGREGSEIEYETLDGRGRLGGGVCLRKDAGWKV